jgi:tRNA-guanine family transglycosylase
MLGGILVTIHNIHFYQRLMGKIRDTIEKDEFFAWSEENLARYKDFGLSKYKKFNHL